MKKKILRLLLSFSVVLTLMLAMSMTAMAATDEVEGIKAEQTVNASNGNIEVTLEVTAKEGYSIEGVTLKNQKPDGYKLLSGEAEVSEKVIQSGKSKILKTVFTKDTGAVNTGDSNSTSILLFGGLAILSAVLIILLITRGKNWSKKIFSLFLCCILVASSAFTFAGKSYAYESESKQIEFSKEVTIGSEKVTVRSVVSYDRIVEDKSVEKPTAVLGLEYTGQEQTGVAEGTGYTVTNGKKTNAGEYQATVKLKAGYKWSDGTKADLEINWSIGKATYDMSEVSFENKNVTYDGQEQTIEISGTLPKGVTVSYTGNKGTDVGTYKAIAKFTGDSTNYNAIDDMGATLTITQVQTISTIADVLATVEGFPGGTEYVNPPDDAWVYEPNKSVYAYKYNGTAMALNFYDGDGHNKLVVLTTSVEAGEDCYTATTTNSSELTFNMKDGKLTSIVFYSTEDETSKRFNGTYAPPAQ